jgi:hypothetical protein
MEEEKAYDACITSDMPAEEKELIKRRIRNHRRAMMTDLFSEFLIPNVYSLAGVSVKLPFVVYNAASKPDTIRVNINDDLGWSIVPNYLDVPLQPEEHAEIPVVIDIPLGYPINTVNPIHLHVNSSITTETMASDTGFIIVRPTVDINIDPPEASGLRGDTIPIEIVAMNLNGGVRYH